jgi:hypothetical protein
VGPLGTADGGETGGRRDDCVEDDPATRR